jgi:alginate O-acetyltransferase complex protein AlgI
MQFNSFTYLLFFLPIVFASYQLFRLSIISKIILFVASCVFYGWEHPWYLIPMFFTAGLDYFASQRIDANTDERIRRRWLITSITLNLALMSFFKYIGWASESLMLISAYFGMTLLTSPIIVPLPPGVSFYTFESISYTVDVYRREFKPRRNLLDYLSFIVFFPHLVAGPIRRAKDLLPRLAEYRETVSVENASRALYYIVWGLFLKIVVADNCGSIVEAIEIRARQEHMLPTGFGLIYGYAFAFQIYGDFAAYSLIARGSALLFNIDVGHNFLTPYFSRNPSEFWSRWHISLSQWLRDYLYIPLGGNQHGRLLTLRNLMITMALGGLWHGAGIFFLFWGLWHGLLLVIYRLVPIDLKLEQWLGPRLGRLLAIVLFFHLVCFGWILFRSSPDVFPIIWDSITSLENFRWGQLRNQFRLLLIFIVPVLVTDYIGWRIGAEFPDAWSKYHLVVRVALILLPIYAIIMLGAREANEFIYFAF